MTTHDLMGTLAQLVALKDHPEVADQAAGAAFRQRTNGVLTRMALGFQPDDRGLTVPTGRDLLACATTRRIAPPTRW